MSTRSLADVRLLQDLLAGIQSRLELMVRTPVGNGADDAARIIPDCRAALVLLRSMAADAAGADAEPAP